MLDFATAYAFCEPPAEDMDVDSLKYLLSTLSDSELDSLQDELDFCSFAGVPSPRILSLMEGVSELDATWRNLHQRWKTPELPAAY